MLTNTPKAWLRLDLLLFVTSLVFFLAFPNIDLTIAAFFYDEHSQSFPGARSELLKIPYLVFAYIHLLYLIALIALAVLFHLRRKRGAGFLAARKKSLYLLCCLILGPGLLVNALLKDNSSGRPRPRDVQAFQGEYPYSAPFEYAGNCQRNCSFTSGHAAGGFIILALAWVFASPAYLSLGIVLGAFLGWMRMAQGAHFLSDVVFSFWVVYGTSFILARYFDLSIEKNISEDVAMKGALAIES